MKVCLWIVAIGAAISAIGGTMFFELPPSDATYSPMYGLSHQEILSTVVVTYVLMILSCSFASIVLATAAVRYPAARRNCIAMSIMTGCFVFMYLVNMMVAYHETYLGLLLHLHPSPFSLVRDIAASALVALVAGAVAVVPEHDLKETEAAR